MGNIPLSAEDIAFLKEKSCNKNSTSDIKKAFKEFTEDLNVDGKKMDDVKIDFGQFCQKCDTVFNTSSEILAPEDNRTIVYGHLFRAFDQDKVRNKRRFFYIFFFNFRYFDKFLQMKL